VGYVPMAEVGAEFLFQVIAERAERNAVIMTTNLPFSEWTQVIPNARRRMKPMAVVVVLDEGCQICPENLRLRLSGERRIWEGDAQAQAALGCGLC